MAQHIASEVTNWNLIKIAPQSNLEQAFIKMAKFRIRHLPVVDSQDTLVGIISDRDLKRALHVELWNGPGQSRIEECCFPQHQVKDFMSWPVKFISEETSLIRAAEIMIEDKISCLMVLGKDKRMGILTHEDLLKHLVQMLKTDSEVDKATQANSRASENLESWIYGSPISNLMENLSNSGI